MNELSRIGRDGGGIASVLGDPDIAALLSRQPPQHNLQADFYLSEAIYRLDLERVILPHWQCVNHASAIPGAGDYLVFAYDRESAIVVRGTDGEIRAFANVCRHRGSRICATSGRARGGRLVCPYHAWAYAFDGSLAHARMMPRDFDTSAYGLKPLPVKVVQGLIFLSFADEPLSFDDCEENLNGTVGAHGWADAKVALQKSIVFSANWKLALENQVECYHCGPAHPEFSEVHGQATKNEGLLVAAMNAKAEAQGIRIPTRDHWALAALPGQEQAYSNRYPMRAGACTASRDGSPVAPLMGRFSAYDNGQTLAYVGPMNHFLCYGDYGAVFRYTPRSVCETELAVIWLVRKDAVDGVDYSLDDLAWMWDVTAAEDKAIVEENQVGVASRFYEPGPYALPLEEKTSRFTAWYLDALTVALR